MIAQKRNGNGEVWSETYDLLSVLSELTVKALNQDKSVQITPRNQFTKKSNLNQFFCNPTYSMGAFRGGGKGAMPPKMPSPELSRFCLKRTKFDQLILAGIVKIVAIRCHSWSLKCIKFVFSWGSAPDPAGGAYSAPPDLLVAFNGPTSKGEGRGKGRFLGPQLNFLYPPMTYSGSHHC